MEFLIQHNLMSEEQLKLTHDAVKEFPHRFIGLIPFSHEITCDTPLIGKDFIPYGSTLLTNLAYEWGWTGLHFDLSRFNYEAATHNRTDMLNDEYIMSLKDAISFMKASRKGRDWFIRPSEDLKQFAGQVIEAWECADWLEDAMLCDTSGSYHLDADTTVVIAEPKNLKAEWRWFIVDGKIVDGSMYRAHNQLIKKHEIDSEVIQEAQELADVWLPDACCVMDTALTDCGVHVVEFNCINSSGFYGHDVAKIFQALHKFHNPGSTP